MKRHLKMAEIRRDSEDGCPFGLPIPFGCQYAGENVKSMSPIDVMGKDSSDDEKSAIGAANTKLLAWNLLRSSEKPCKCIYAGHLLEKQGAVECNHDDSAPGQGSAQALQAAPFYSKMFNGIINGLYSYPVGYFGDFNISRNMYYGTYSMQGADRHELLHVIAEEIANSTKTGNTKE